MAVYALVENNIVKNIIIADDLETAQAVSADGHEAVLVENHDDGHPAHIGLSYYPETNTFEQPSAPSFAGITLETLLKEDPSLANPDDPKDPSKRPNDPNWTPDLG